jgi:hypothetical protein
MSITNAVALTSFLARPIVESTHMLRGSHYQLVLKHQPPTALLLLVLLPLLLLVVVVVDVVVVIAVAVCTYNVCVCSSAPLVLSYHFNTSFRYFF